MLVTVEDTALEIVHGFKCECICVHNPEFVILNYISMIRQYVNTFSMQDVSLSVVRDIPSTFQSKTGKINITCTFNNASQAIPTLYDFLGLTPKNSTADTDVTCYDACCTANTAQTIPLQHLINLVNESGGLDELIRRQNYTFAFVDTWSKDRGDRRGLLAQYRQNASTFVVLGTASQSMVRGVAAMNVEELRTWLVENELQDIAEYFYSNAFNGLMMMEMSEADIKEAIPDVTLPQRKRLMGLINQQKQAPSPAAVAVHTATIPSSTNPTKSEDAFQEGMKRGAGEVVGKTVAKQALSIIF